MNRHPPADGSAATASVKVSYSATFTTFHKVRRFVSEYELFMSMLSCTTKGHTMSAPDTAPLNLVVMASPSWFSLAALGSSPSVNVGMLLIAMSFPLVAVWNEVYLKALDGDILAVSVLR